MAHRLDDLLAPLGADAFFTDHAGRTPVHLAGAPSRLALPDWPGLAALLNMTALWSAETLTLLEAGQPVDAARYCAPATDRDLQPVQRPIAARVLALQADGAVLVARQIESLSPGLKRIAADLEAAFAARATAELHVYRHPAAAPAGQRALTDVWLLGLAGTARVRVAAGTLEHPVSHPTLVQPLPAPSAHEALLEARLTHGDRLYIPRGAIHAVDALSPDTALATVTVTRALGLDVLQALADAAVDDPLFRAALPPDGPARAAHLAELGNRLAALAAGPAGNAAATRIERSLQRDLADYQLPTDGPAAVPGPARYRRNASGLAVVETPQGWQLRGARGAAPIPPGREQLVAWVIGRAEFTRGELADAFPAVPTSMIETLLGELAAMKVVTPVP